MCVCSDSILSQSQTYPFPLKNNTNRMGGGTFSAVAADLPTQRSLRTCGCSPWGLWLLGCELEQGTAHAVCLLHFVSAILPLLWF